MSARFFSMVNCGGERGFFSRLKITMIAMTIIRYTYIHALLTNREQHGASPVERREFSRDDAK